MKLIQINAVKESYDRDITDIAYFTDHSAANAFIASKKKASVYYGTTEFNQTFRIYDSLEDYKIHSIASVKANAMAKLTPEEIAALGL